MSENVLRIAICDDDIMSRETNALMTQKVLEDAGIRYETAMFKSANELLDEIQKGTEFQILLLDVMMNEMDGMELATELRKHKSDAEIIFISGDRDTALRGYEVAAARYLIKPVMLERLKEALMFCYERHCESLDYIVLPVDGNYKLYLSEISYVEAFDRGTRFYLQDQVLDTKLKISEVEALLPADTFILCHRAFIVNVKEIRAVRRYEIEMKDGSVVPVSRIRYPEVCESFVK